MTNRSTAKALEDARGSTEDITMIMDGVKSNKTFVTKTQEFEYEYIIKHWFFSKETTNFIIKSIFREQKVA